MTAPTTLKDRIRRDLNTAMKARDELTIGHAADGARSRPGRGGRRADRSPAQ
ncbi:MAG: hypothetical protein WKF47_03110 [Geodermatophilaceae bacterium]